VGSKENFLGPQICDDETTFQHREPEFMLLRALEIFRKNFHGPSANDVQEASRNETRNS
jgi:hypothetical protein